MEKIRKIQLIEVEILKEIDRICKKNDINYFLDSGTALGAVRHKGFIPWDDDIDIGMTRENYNKFLEIAEKELQDKFILQSIEKTENYPAPYAKVRNKNTLYMSHAWKRLKLNQGIWVDIFPYDTFSSKRKKELKKMLKRYQFFQKIYYHATIPDRTASPDNSFKWKIGNILKNLIYYFLKLYPKNIIKKQLNKILLEFNKKEDDIIVCLCGDGKVFSKKMMEELVEIEFEGNNFSIMKETDEYLKAMYGNYMVLPPLEKRQGHSIYKFEIFEGNSNE